MTSEFGKGFVYNLGLFLAHADRIHKDLEAYKSIGRKNGAYEMWFYGAGDHLFEFQPQCAPTKALQTRCEKFRDRVLSLRLPTNGETATRDDYEWAVQEAKDLLRLIDKANNVPTEKEQWE